MSSKYTRPCFLTWGADLARLVLGPPVLDELARVMSSVGLPPSGVVARPLCSRTARVPGGMRTAMASMSRIIQGGPGRSEHLCRQCASGSGCASVSDSVRLRALLLYALTASETGDDLPTRMKPFRAAVQAPPDS